MQLKDVIIKNFALKSFLQSDSPECIETSRDVSILVVVNWTSCIARFKIHRTIDGTYAREEPIDIPDDAASFQVILCFGEDTPRPLCYLDTLVDSNSASTKGFLFKCNGRYTDAHLFFSLDRTTSTEKGHEVYLEPRLSLDIVSLIPDVDPQKPARIYAVGESIKAKFDSSRNKADIDLAIETYVKALELIETDHSTYWTYLHAYGLSLLLRYECTKDVSDIEASIASLDAVINGAPEDDPERARWLNNVGNAYRDRYTHLSDARDIESAIASLRKSVLLTGDQEEDLPRRLGNLGNCLVDRFELLEDEKDIEEAISVQKRAVGLTVDSDKAYPIRVNNLGNTLLTLFQYNSKLETIDDAIRVLESANVEISHYAKPYLLNTLSNCYLLRHGRTGNIDDLKKMSGSLEEAKRLTAPDSPLQASLLSNLGSCYRNLFEETNDSTYLDKAIASQREGLPFVPQNHASLPNVLNNLGYSLLRRFERGGERQDINECISLFQRAIALTPEAHPDSRVWLHSLGTAFCYRFKYTGALYDIDESIRSLQQAAYLTSEKHTALYQLVVNSLGNALLARFKRTGKVRDLGDAIGLFRKRIGVLSDGYPEISGALNNLGIALYEKHKKDGDLDEAIDVIRQAVSVNSANPEFCALYLSNLGNVLLAKAEKLSDPECLRDAVNQLSKAVDLTAGDHSSLPSRLTTLGTVLVALYKTDGDLQSLKRAIELHQKSIALSPENHAELTSRYNNLGNAFISAWKESQDIEDLKSAADAFQKAAMNTSGPPHLRLLTARMWGFTCLKIDPRRSLSGYAVAISLLPAIAWIGDPVSDRYLLLSTVPDLVNDAVCTALKFGLSTLAVEWFEQGRGILWSQLNQLRTPLDQLRDVDNELAESLEKVSRRLRMAGTRESGLQVDIGTVQRVNAERDAREHHRLAEEWEQLVDKVRSIEGFEKFLLPLEFEETAAHLPSTSVVILINVSELGCDAMILNKGSSKPPVVHLGGFSHEKAKALHRSLAASLSSAGILTRAGRPAATANVSNLAYVLEELWSAVAKPVLDYLQETSLMKESKQHIWWCLSGLLSFLPLHAAGIYGKGAKNQCLMESVISSYIPTLSVLVSATPHKDRSQLSSILVVGNANAPGLPEIASVNAEVEEIRGICDANAIAMEAVLGEFSTPDTVLRTMKDYSWIHLACHASQNITNPVSSAFHLHGGNLELSQIISESNPLAEFAFLSACQTATGDQNIPQESIHLASAMISAGYKRVIGTPWPIFDEEAPMVAAHVYKAMIVDGSSSIDALHGAISAMRSRIVGSDELSLLCWVPYIHVGL